MCVLVPWGLREVRIISEKRASERKIREQIKATSAPDVVGVGAHEAEQRLECDLGAAQVFEESAERK